MTIRQAIEKAMEAGWYKEIEVCDGEDGIGEDVYEIALLDPLFWQALGKGLGNKDEMRCSSERCDQKQCEYAGYKDPKRMFDDFHDSIWYGGTPESFFEKL